MLEIKGRIEPVKNIKNHIEKKDLKAIVEKPLVIKEEILPHYEGQYIVDPKNYDIVLETQNKVLDDDVKVKEVNIYSVSIPDSTGKVIYIGE